MRYTNLIVNESIFVVKKLQNVTNMAHCVLPYLLTHLIIRNYKKCVESQGDSALLKIIHFHC